MYAVTTIYYDGMLKKWGAMKNIYNKMRCRNIDKSKLRWYTELNR